MAQATISCCFAAIHLEAVKKTRRGRVFRPLQNPSFSERTRYGCGQKTIMVAVCTVEVASIVSNDTGSLLHNY